MSPKELLKQRCKAGLCGICGKDNKGRATSIVLKGIIYYVICKGHYVDGEQK